MTIYTLCQKSSCISAGPLCCFCRSPWFQAWNRVEFYRSDVLSNARPEHLQGDDSLKLLKYAFQGVNTLQMYQMSVKKTSVR